MSAPELPVLFTRRAESQVIEATRWWRENRLEAPDAITDALSRALLIIARHPAGGAPARSPRLTGVRRVLLADVHYHLYYRVRPKLRRVEVLAFWHASRGVAPALPSR